MFSLHSAGKKHVTSAIQQSYEAIASFVCVSKNNLGFNEFHILNQHLITRLPHAALACSEQSPLSTLLARSWHILRCARGGGVAFTLATLDTQLPGAFSSPR